MIRSFFWLGLSGSCTTERRFESFLPAWVRGLHPSASMRSPVSTGCHGAACRSPIFMSLILASPLVQASSHRLRWPAYLLYIRLLSRRSGLLGLADDIPSTPALLTSAPRSGCLAAFSGLAKGHWSNISWGSFSPFACTVRPGLRCSILMDWTSPG